MMMIYFVVNKLDFFNLNYLNKNKKFYRKNRIVFENFFQKFRHVLYERHLNLKFMRINPRVCMF